jgi:hypothetical protein
MEELKVRNWKELTRNKKEWNKLVEKKKVAVLQKNKKRRISETVNCLLLAR